jgi:predicted P-loop ATPase
LPEQLTTAITESGDKLTFSKGGRPEATAGNVVVLFRNDPRLRGLLAYNELAQRAERVGPWSTFDRGASGKVGPVVDDDLTRVSMWLAAEMGMKMDHRDLMRGLDAAAMDARFDPLADRLRELGAAWDGVPRVGSWLTKYARIDATDCAEYVEAVGRCFLVGAVARALEPACQMDTVLAVEGVGGARKSSMFKVLADSVADGLFADGVHDVSNPVALVEGTSGRWIVELAELAGIRRAQDVEALKAAITRREDSHRRPYALMPRDYPRRFVFVATTNRTEYLSDPTGALLRRFWPMRTLATESDPIDCDALAVDAAQLWGEAVRMFQSGTPWHLSPSDGKAYTQWEAGRELRREDGAFHDEAVHYIMTDWFEFYPEGQGRSLTVIAKAVGDMRTVEGDQASRNRLADTLRTLDMESLKKGGKKLWYFTPKAYRRFFVMRDQDKLDKRKQDKQSTVPGWRPVKVGAN